MTVIPLAPFIVIPYQAASFAIPVIETVLQTVRMVNGAWHLPENHFTEPTIGIHIAGTMKEYCSHMAHYTIRPK